ncbi:MAG: hypothetical protein ABI240_09815 [Sphingomonas sp.]
MDLPRTAGIALGLASTLLGLYGLVHVKPLPLSARLGALAPLDRNQDGRISATEWAQAGRAPAAMAALDINKNGFIEPAEARARRKPPGGGD